MISIDVVKFTNHENYNTTTYENDISILELAEEQTAPFSMVVILRYLLCSDWLTNILRHIETRLLVGIHVHIGILMR